MKSKELKCEDDTNLNMKYQHERRVNEEEEVKKYSVLGWNTREKQVILFFKSKQIVFSWE